MLTRFLGAAIRTGHDDIHGFALLVRHPLGSSMITTVMEGACENHRICRKREMRGGNMKQARRCSRRRGVFCSGGLLTRLAQ